jgi:hypothetical protein
MVWKALVVEKAAKAAKDSSRCALMGFIYALKLAGIVSLEGAHKRPRILLIYLDLLHVEVYM